MSPEATLMSPVSIVTTRFSNDIHIRTGENHEIILPPEHQDLLPKNPGDTVTFCPDKNGGVILDGGPVEKVVLGCGPYVQEIKRTWWQHLLLF